MISALFIILRDAQAQIVNELSALTIAIMQIGELYFFNYLWLFVKQQTQLFLNQWQK